MKIPEKFQKKSRKIPENFQKNFWILGACADFFKKNQENPENAFPGVACGGVLFQKKKAAQKSRRSRTCIFWIGHSFGNPRVSELNPFFANRVSGH